MLKSGNKNPTIKTSFSFRFFKNSIQDNSFFKESDSINIENRRISFEIKRIFKSCQILLFILDVRNPLGTWPNFLNSKDKYESKKILLVLNKCDLVPLWITEKWVKILSSYFLVLPFFSKKQNNLEKQKIVTILKQIKNKFYPGKKEIYIGILGYPNVGKSSFINSLIEKKSLKVSFIPGQTKTWQFVRLSNGIFLLDSPGVFSGESSIKDVGILKGYVRLNKISNYNLEIIDILKKLIGRFEKINWKKVDSLASVYDNMILKDKTLGEDCRGIFSGKIIKLVNAFLSGFLPWFSPIPEIKYCFKKYCFIKNWYINIPY